MTRLDYASMMRLLIPSVAALALGVQIVMASFLFGILDLPVHRLTATETEPQRSDT
jgi:hypothetical protein